MNKIKEFIPLIKLMDKDKNNLVLASILIIISGISEIFNGYLNGSAIESITQLKLKEAIIYLGIYFLLQLTINGYVSFIAKSMLLKIESSLTRKISFFTYEKALNLPVYAYEQMSSGEIINRITNDAEVLSFTFGKLLNTFSYLIGSMIIIVYIFINSWIIGLEIIIMLVILYIIIKKYSPKLEKICKENKQEQDKFTSIVSESIRGIREIKTLGIKKNLISEIKEVIKIIYKKSVQEIDIQKKFDISVDFFKTTLETIVFLTCIVLIYYDKISLTFFIAMTYYIYRYMWLIENLNEFTQTYQKIIVSVSRINEILDNKLYEDNKFGKIELKSTKGVIEFKNVAFSYPNEDKILNNFNLKITPNKKIAIVGKSGQGKSTLFNLLTKLFDVTQGEILIDNVNIKDLTEEKLREHISIIRQEPFIFNKTIKENFELVDKKITIQDIRKYCKMSYIDDYIMSLPNKYDTILGEGGVKLSGGQKQRLAIARTLSKKSKIILFDEATSALDNESQEFIKKAIDNLVCNHTVVIVAHRLSTIIDADIIHVVDKGKIIASGKHNELLNTNKIYKNLYKIETLY